MIKLELNGVILPLVERKISIKMVNPMFNLEVVPGINTYPFNVVRTNESAAALKYPEIEGNVELFDEKINGARIYFKDTLLFVGFLRLLAVNSKSYRLVFYSGTANILNFADNSLRTLSLGGVRYIPHTLSIEAATVLADPDNSDYLFIPHRNPDLYEGVEDFYFSSQPVNRDWFNFYRLGYGDGIGTNSGGSASEPYMINSFVPWPYFHYVFKQVFKEHNVVLKSNFLTDDVIRKLLIYNSHVLDAPGPSSIGVDYYPNQATQIDLRNHVPDTTIAEFLKYARRAFNLCFDYSLTRPEVRVETFDYLLAKAPDVNWTEKEIVGSQIDFKEKQNSIHFTIRRDNSDNEERDTQGYGLVLRDYWVNKGFQTVEIGKSLIIGGVAADPFFSGRGFRAPFFKQKGNSATYALNNTFDLRLVFYVPGQEDNLDDPFPFGSDDYSTIFSEVPIPGGFSIRDAQKQGDHFYKQFIDMMGDPKILTKTFKWELEDVLNFSFHHKIHHRNHNYFAMRADLVIGDIIEPVKVELKKV